MRVLILHDPVAEDARPDERDTLTQATAVEHALRRLGRSVDRAAFSGDLAADARTVERARPDVVFNLVESVLGRERLIHVAPALVEALGVPCTGAPSEALCLSTGKLAAKRVLRAHGLPTPPAYSADELRRGIRIELGRYVVKAVWEHGSLGLEADAVVEPRDARELLTHLDARCAAMGGEALAELYVHGRELNVALLAGPGGPEVLPLPEILFPGLAPDAPRLVGYRAKWDPDSPEWAGTPRCFVDEDRERELVTRLAALARSTWNAFGLAGAARVDVRLDGTGDPFVIDVNANPCLTPDAGFAATLDRAGIPYENAIARLVDDALARHA